MLRLKTRITVYKKDEETNQRALDFPYTQEIVDHLSEEIHRLVDGVHLVDDDGNLYVLGVSNVEQLS